MDTAMRDPGPGLRAAIGLMLLSLTVMLGAVTSLYFLPLQVAPLVGAALYAGLWACERHLRMSSPITWIMTVFYAVFALIRYRIDDLSWVAWFSPLVHGTLAVLIFALLLAGRPFTALRTGGGSFAPLHRALSLIWGGAHLGAGVAALTLIPSPAFLYVPLGLMGLGAFATVWLNFVSMGPAFERPRRFEIEGYSFREAATPKDREAFHRVIAEAYRVDLQSALGPRRRIDAAEIRREHLASNRKRGDDFLPFLVFAGDRPVGGICIFFDHRRHGLPIEDEAKIDLTPWRRRGPVAEVGRFGVLRRYRLSPVLLKGLFKCVVEAAAERRVHFIFNDSFGFQARMYEKLGFRALHTDPYISEAEHSTGYGLEVLPMVLDLAGIVRGYELSAIPGDMRDDLAPYVMERFFKHLVVRDLASALLGPAHPPQEAENARA